ALKACSAAPMATLATPIRSLEQLHAPSCVKVVCGHLGQALYFSRSPIPHVRDRDEEEVLAAASPWLLHVGIYAYRSEFLSIWPQIRSSPLKQWEKLEQLRALEAGIRIQVAVVEHRSVGIDTPDDYARFVARTRSV
ncbi:MAG TPA: 3-deoxy-manno-octulosonate cytidylyltransferase, partial [Planctomycetaceae bacterium]|nr:3-deoxy-manno-octulosonate cytidylyltransferase [Planctomycetaceae bacterium]